MMSKRNSTSILLLDGGLGTTLADQYGVLFGPETPLWSSHLLVSDPGLLKTCQQAFAHVPVHVLLAATYQCSANGFRRTKTTDFPAGIDSANIVSFLDTAVSIAQEATQKTGQVALSLGPYGACMIPSQEYSGRYDAAHASADALHEWHLERMLLYSGVARLAQRISYVAFETVPRLDEIHAIRRLFANERVRDLLSDNTGLKPFWISCVYPDEDHLLPDGSTPEQVVNAMLGPAQGGPILPWGIGINCTKVGKLGTLVERYTAAVENMIAGGVLKRWPCLVLYPDGTNGEVYNTATQTWDPPDRCSQPAIPWEAQLATIVDAAKQGAQWESILVGGCCKSSPRDIYNLRHALGGNY